MKFSPTKLESGSNTYLAFPAQEAKPILFRLATYESIAQAKEELTTRLSNEAHIAQLNRSLFTNKQAELEATKRQGASQAVIIIISGIGASVVCFLGGYLLGRLN